jgi:phage terminase large subunit
MSIAPEIEVDWDKGWEQPGDNSAQDRPVDLPAIFLPLLEPRRYKVTYGGRGSAKSWAIARALLMLASTSKLRILCCREYQTSIAESVHYILLDQMRLMGLAPWFRWTDSSITCVATGSQFIFKGLRHNVNEIKSLEAVDICWIEEAQAVSRASWIVLEPTIRKVGSEIWVSYNPLNDTDIIHETFVVKGVPEELDGRPYAWVQKVNWSDNPYFPPDLDQLRRRQLNDDQDVYLHIWEGHTLKHSDAMIFKNKWEVVDGIAPPEGARLFYGIDWGFSQDPLAAVRCWIEDECLCVDYAIGAKQVDLPEMAPFLAGSDPLANEHQPPRWQNPKGFQGIPGILNWPVKADNARPELISYMQGQGFNVTAAEKWKGSVEDGIAHLRGFRKIRIHPRCVGLIEEALQYRYKVDKQTEQVLPLIVDAYNHFWDALRYALDGYIQARGDLGVWEALAQ